MDRENAQILPKESTIMQDDGSWRLSPAYDITYVIGSGGYLPDENHCLYIKAKLRNITREDVIRFAHDNGIRRPDAIIRDVAGALIQFRSVATRNGVLEQWIGRVEAAIVNHMKAWGEWEEGCQASILTVNGYDVCDFRIEQQFKGRYLLQATIGGKDLRYIIRKKTPELDYTFNRNFGVEIEVYNCTMDRLARELQAAGIMVAVERYNHTDHQDHWKLVTDASLSGHNTFELVSPILHGEDGINELEKVCWALDFAM